VLVPRVSRGIASSEQRRKMFLSGLLGSRNQEAKFAHLPCASAPEFRDLGSGYVPRDGLRERSAGK
jgi:hypothetical protein